MFELRSSAFEEARSLPENDPKIDLRAIRLFSARYSLLTQNHSAVRAFLTTRYSYAFPDEPRPQRVPRKESTSRTFLFVRDHHSARH
jgi:hypothetical protein